MVIPRIAKVLTAILSGLFFVIIYFIVLIAEDGYVEKKESSLGYPSDKIATYQPNSSNKNLVCETGLASQALAP
jgi:hypothetical protein